MTDGGDGSKAPSELTSVRLGCVLVATVLLGTAPVAAATATSGAQPTAETPAEPAFVVALSADGSARTTLVVTFDLTTDGERAAFERLRGNATARERRTDRFAARMRAIADRATAESGRNVVTRDAAIAFTERNGTGVVALSVAWDGLATREGDRLVLREPFDGGFALDRTFRVVGPEGYALAAVAPSPDDRTRAVATWTGGATFDRFEATFAPDRERATDESEGTGTAASGPGLGVGSGVLAALLGGVLLASRRRGRGR